MSSRQGLSGRLRRALLLALALMVLAPAAALADGDPGSDVLLDQNLFTTTLSVRQQLDLGGLLDATASAGAPIRVAIVSSQSDLGTVTLLWHRPQTYAEYLGYELSLSYSGRLLVVMPNGYGVYWHADPAGANKLARELAGRKPTSDTPNALTAAVVTAVNRIEAAAGVDASRLAHLEKTGAAGTQSSASRDAATPAGSPKTHPTSGSTSSAKSGHRVPSGLLLAAILVLLALYIGWRSGRLQAVRGLVASWLRGATERGTGERGTGERRAPRVRPFALLPTLLLAIVVAALVINHSDSGSSASGKVALATNPHIDPGTTLAAREAPGFTLTDQTGRAVSLRQYRGKVVILAFIDAECQTICPLTSTAMLDAKSALGRAGNQVQLLAVNANWRSHQVEDVLNYTELHGMTGQWNFLTGSLAELRRVWSAYRVNEQALESKNSNVIDHVAALYVIDPRGRLRKVYTTYPSYASVPQMGQLLAQEASSLLPGRPAVLTHYSYAQRPEINPTRSAALSKLGGGTVSLGPGKSHLYLFFATWDAQTTPLAGELDELNAYERAARAKGLPSVTAVDEASVEPSTRALSAFIHTIPQPLSYPVAIDRTGSVADGYGVQGEPWFVLTNAAGKIVWYQEIYTAGWPSLARLQQEVHNDLSNSPTTAPDQKQAAAALAGSPAPLAALHTQSAQLLGGGQSALDARIRALRGYPIVLNIWASSCAPCQAEFGLFATASERYGKRVAFLGADNADSANDARAFLSEHHVSYPSYATTASSIDKILVGGLEGTPTTVYISTQGKVLYVHTGQYESEGALDSDIQDYALGPAQ